jgi:hypothetical protein
MAQQQAAQGGDPNADPNAVPPQEGDPNMVAPMQGDPNQVDQGTEENIQDPNTYYNDPDDDDVNPDDDDEDSPDDQQPIRKGVSKMDEPTVVSDTDLKDMVSKAVAAAQVPFMAKMNELIESNNKLHASNADLVKSLEARNEELTTLLKSVQTPAVETPTTVAPATPEAEPAPDVTKGVGDDITIDPSAVKHPGGVASPKYDASALIKSAEAIRDRGDENAASIDVVKALRTVQTDRDFSEKALEALSDAIQKAKG